MIIDWAVLVRDVVHNTRAALDQAVWELVGLCGDTPDRGTQFPAAQSAEKFKAPSMRGTHPYIRDAVRALEP